MKKKIIILGSTGSIGSSTLNVIKKNKRDFNIICLSTNKNYKKILKQSYIYKVKNIIINNEKTYHKVLKTNKHKGVKIFNNLDLFLNSFKKKVDYTILGISGFAGLEPTLKIIPFTKNLCSANKESIICGWKLIKKKLNQHKTNFIPLDSEHFSIWSLISKKNINSISSIYLTASGGPFLNIKKNKLNKVKVKHVIKHPNWNMGKKISTDSATMMNKIFELIEASKIFNLSLNKFNIIIHPKSYIHAIVNYKSGLSYLVAHDTNMEIPISNSLYIHSKNKLINKSNINFDNLNGINFIKPSSDQYPYLNILKYIKLSESYFEIILVAINDFLVRKFLENKISYLNMQKYLLKFININFFKKFYKLKPNNINDINSMIDIVNNYLNNINYKK